MLTMAALMIFGIGTRAALGPCASSPRAFLLTAWRGSSAMLMPIINTLLSRPGFRLSANTYSPLVTGGSTSDLEPAETILRDVELKLALGRVRTSGSKLIGHKGGGNGDDSPG